MHACAAFVLCRFSRSSSTRSTWDLAPSLDLSDSEKRLKQCGRAVFVPNWMMDSEGVSIICFRPGHYTLEIHFRPQFGQAKQRTPKTLRSAVKDLVTFFSFFLLSLMITITRISRKSRNSPIGVAVLSPLLMTNHSVGRYRLFSLDSRFRP